MDKELWNNTMNDLRKGSERSIDRVVWVFNAAWQRGTADRELMLEEFAKIIWNPSLQTFEHCAQLSATGYEQDLEPRNTSCSEAEVYQLDYECGGQDIQLDLLARTAQRCEGRS